MANWYIEKGPESDVVISSRIRLARNLKEFPFPSKMDDEQGKLVLDRVREAAANLRKIIQTDLTFVDIRRLSPIERQALVEKHLISPDLSEGSRESGVLISKDEYVSIMVNEEDHLRIQCLFPGMQIKSAWKACEAIESALEEKIEFAYSGKLGYLTCCPTNLGTGIRASAMLHLPALVMTGYIRGVLEACGKLGIAVRGLYGENSEASGSMFQISNQVTLGQSEEEITANISSITSQVIEQERALRQELYKRNRYRFEDRVFRSLGACLNARIMSSEESMKLLSDVRLGIDMGIIKEIKIERLNEVMLLMQPASLQKTVGKQLSPDDRDIKRAELVRSCLIKA